MHFVKSLLILTLLVFKSITSVQSFKYLFIFPSHAQSHYILGSALAKALANKGHQVYVISAYPEKKPIKNYYEITFGADEAHIRGDFSSYFIPTDNSEQVLRDVNVQLLIHSNHNFDAVVCESSLSDALYGFSEHFKAPLILLSTIGAIQWNTDVVGSPSPPSYVPNYLSTFTDRMTFVERITNLYTNAWENYNFHTQILPQQIALYNKYFPHLKKDLPTVRKSAAAVLLNSHVSLRYPRPYMPNQIEVGGMHINKQLQPLPEDIEQFIQESEHGVIYFSMGSFILGKYLPEPVLAKFMKAFKAIKQRVLWKLEEPQLRARYKNIFISDWFPQDEILAHQNVKAFISHGGMLSLTESIYHGKPIIGIPIYYDQFSNMAYVEHQGIGIKLDFPTLTSAMVVDAIQRITHNKRYTARVKVVSERFRDQPIAPLDLAVHRVEHVARHKGANYMRSACLDLNPIAYHNIDAMLILFGGILTFFWYAIKGLCALKNYTINEFQSVRRKQQFMRNRKRTK